MGEDRLLAAWSRSEPLGAALSVPRAPPPIPRAERRRAGDGSRKPSAAGKDACDAGASGGEVCTDCPSAAHIRRSASADPRGLSANSGSVIGVGDCLAPPVRRCNGGSGRLPVRVAVECCPPKRVQNLRWGWTCHAAAAAAHGWLRRAAPPTPAGPHASSRLVRQPYGCLSGLPPHCGACAPRPRLQAQQTCFSPFSLSVCSLRSS
jgi:hypothetical protein